MKVKIKTSQDNQDPVINHSLLHSNLRPKNNYWRKSSQSHARQVWEYESDSCKDKMEPEISTTSAPCTAGSSRHLKDLAPSSSCDHLNITFVNPSLNVVVFAYLMIDEWQSRSTKSCMSSLYQESPIQFSRPPAVMIYTP